MCAATASTDRPPTGLFGVFLLFGVLLLFGVFLLPTQRSAPPRSRLRAGDEVPWIQGGSADVRVTIPHRQWRGPKALMDKARGSPPSGVLCQTLRASLCVRSSLALTRAHVHMTHMTNMTWSIPRQGACADASTQAPDTRASVPTSGWASCPPPRHRARMCRGKLKGSEQVFVDRSFGSMVTLALVMEEHAGLIKAMRTFADTGKVPELLQWKPGAVKDMSKGGLHQCAGPCLACQRACTFHVGQKACRPADGTACAPGQQLVREPLLGTISSSCSRPRMRLCGEERGEWAALPCCSLSKGHVLCACCCSPIKQALAPKAAASYSRSWRLLLQPEQSCFP